MIDLMFSFGNDVILVRIDGANVTFGNTSYGAMMAPISGLKLSREGAIREWPDLMLADDWKEKAIERFKAKIKDMTSENEIAEYIINDLKLYGYIPKLKQQSGMRPVKLS